ncbi:TPA: GBS Bsp-like repeat-containing protein, partial [Streptococcus suis]|nr:GBS Bsp-like repeat-containing protein [Streptococcus suis]
LTTTTENTETVTETTESQTSVTPVESSQSSTVETSTSTSTSEGTISSPASETSSTLSSETSKPVSEVANSRLTTSASSALRTAASVRSTPTPRQEIVSVQQIEQTLELKYNLPVSSGEVIRFAVWSDKNSQDDIIWYSADQTGAAYVELKKHKDYGLYHIHTYSDRSGRFTGLNATSINVAAPKPVSSKAVLKTESSFEVTITDVPSHISSVSVPIWSDNKGQDDIIWYTAQKRADGSYGVLVDTQKHKTDTGTYHIHVYGQNSQTGKLDGLSATSLTVPARQITKPVSAKAVLKTESSFEVSITDVPSHISSVSVPIWSDNKGQDDIIWYTAQKRADGSYGVLVDTQKHKTDTGTYHIHVYGQNSQTGKLDGLSATTITVPAPKATKPVSSKAVLKTESSFEVTITDVPSHISSVSVPIWSETKGQDDIIWYTAQKRADGSYGVLVDTQKHKTDTGIYHIHVYGQNSQTGKLDGLSATTVTVPVPQTTKPVSAKAVLKTSSSFEVNITDVPSHVSGVSVPVWSENKGQDDIIWYTAQKRTDGSYGVLIDTQKHKTDTGIYHIHVYGQNSQTGKLEGLSATQITLAARPGEKSDKAIITTSYRGTGVYGLDISNVSKQGEVLFAVWSDTNGQDDIKWYGTKQITSSVYFGTFDTKQHKNVGTYHIHVYQKIDGKMSIIGATAQNVTRNSYNLPINRQGDIRWGGLYYGLSNLAMTGCVPTALSMVYSSLKNETITPVVVANYLYNHTPHFNKNFLGTSSLGIFAATKNWGLKSSVLNTQAELASTLNEGHYVVAAVQGNKFVASANPSVSHEIVLSGYQNGMTRVADPFTGRTEWYSVARLFNEASRDKDDTAHKGKPFIKITD